MPFRPKNTGTWDVNTTMKIEAIVIFHTPDALLNNIKKFSCIKIIIAVKFVKYLIQ